MFFKTSAQSQDWIALSTGITGDLPDSGPIIETMHGIRIDIERDRYRAYVVAKRLVSWLGKFDSALFWIREYGIWPSSDNWHLYYRLRASYGERTVLHDAPGHMFLNYEKNDLVTLLHLAILFGWGGHVVPVPASTYIYLSHDGWVHVDSEDEHRRIMSDADEFSFRLLEGGDES